MVIGIGIDIIEINRIKKNIEKHGDKFLSRVFTSNEIDYCLPKSNKYQHFAARYAAKEAVYKALASGCQEGLSWQDVEISNEPNGMPVANVSGKLKKFFSDDKQLKISMSHSRNYVTCVAIIYKVKSE